MFVKCPYFYPRSKKNPEHRINAILSGSEPSGTRTPDNLIKSLPANPIFKPFVRLGVTSGVTLPKNNIIYFMVLSGFRSLALTVFSCSVKR